MRLKMYDEIAAKLQNLSGVVAGMRQKFTEGTAEDVRRLQRHLRNFESGASTPFSRR